LIETLFDNKQKGRRLQRGLPHKRQRPTQKHPYQFLFTLADCLTSRLRVVPLSSRRLSSRWNQARASLQIDCQDGASQNGITGGGIMPGSVSELPLPTYLQDECSQPQPISATPDFSAFLQYSLQYFSSGSIKQSQVGCAHFRSLSAIRTASLPWSKQCD